MRKILAVIVLSTLLLTSCDYFKKRKVKDNYIEVYSNKIEETELNIKQYRSDIQLKENYKQLFLSQIEMVNTIIEIRQSLYMRTDSFTMLKNEIKREFDTMFISLPDTSDFISKKQKEINYYQKKIENIKDLKFDFDSETEEIKQLISSTFAERIYIFSSLEEEIGFHKKIELRQENIQNEMSKLLGLQIEHYTKLREKAEN